jgi:hypothetical protein
MRRPMRDQARPAMCTYLLVLICALLIHSQIISLGKSGSAFVAVTSQLLQVPPHQGLKFHQGHLMMQAASITITCLVMYI